MGVTAARRPRAPWQHAPGPASSSWPPPGGGVPAAAGLSPALDAVHASSGGVAPWTPTGPPLPSSSLAGFSARGAVADSAAAVVGNWSRSTP